jgi:hypothetical protein
MIDVCTLRMWVAVYKLVHRRFQLIGSNAWPMANGRIFESSLQHDDIHGLAAELTYSYTVFGEYYSGIYRRGFRRKKRAEAFLERFPRESPIPVRYKSQRPEISTLLLSDLSLLMMGL